MKKTKIVQDLYRSQNVYSTLFDIKLLDYKTASKKIKQAIGHPITKTVLYHNKSRPKSFNELRNTKQLGNTGNLEGELAWFINSLKKYSKEIVDFLSYEKKVEKFILFDEFDKAKELINEINEKICYSYWAMENLFSIEEKLNDTECNWTLLKKINSKIEIRYSLFFSGNFSKKAEKDTTLLQYKRELENTLKGLDKKDLEYILFKLAYFYTNDYSEYSHFLHTENISSIIDKYLILINILFELANIKEHRELVNSVLNELNSYGIEDYRLDRIAEFCKFKALDNFNEQIINLFDIYSVGDYENSLKLSRKLIHEKSNSIELHEIYIKSLIELDKPFEKTNISPTIDFVLENLFSVFIRNSDYYTSRENLLKLYLCFPNISFFKQLLSLVSNLTGIESIKNIINKSTYIYSHYSNPALISIDPAGIEFNFDKTLLEKHISLKINHSISTNDFNVFKKGDLPQRKLDIYKLRANYYNHKKENMITVIGLYKNSNLNNFYNEEIILYLYNAYLKENKVTEAITVFVDAYFKNKYFVERLKKSSLLNYIIDKNYKIEDISIDLPIYFYFEDANSYYQYTSLEVFLDSIPLSKPSEINYTDFEDTQKLIFLFKNVCTIDVLNNFYLIFDSEAGVIEERKKILRILAILDTKNSDSYFEEIATLSQKLKIKEIIETVNDGKINLNFTRIKEDKEYNLENSFNRFIKFKDFSDLNEMSLLDTSELVISYLSELKKDTTKLQQASFVSFKSLFFEIVDYFLFSNEHGLDGDLSTRIRHGVLENQLRSVFINKNLIASKNKDNEYNNVSYWKDLCKEKSYPSLIIEKLQKALKEFSQTIDEYIASIINDYIQIQSNRHTQKNLGLFNYRFTDEILWIIYKEVTDSITNYDDFLNYTFDFLKAHTETLLKTIISEFQQSINNNFQGALQNLEDEIAKDLNIKDEVNSEINQNIYNTKTLIQNELYNISEWFKISNNLDNSTLDIQTIIQTAIESINLTVNDIKPKVNVNSKHFFEAGFYYIDIFKILIENSIKHSELSIKDLEININAKTLILYDTIGQRKDPVLKLIVNVSNNLNDDIDYNTLKDKLEILINNWNTELSTVNKEGGSGFQKIKRILKYDIESLESELTFKLVGTKLDFFLEIIHNIKGIDNE
jgi:hypothetical protein